MNQQDPRFAAIIQALAGKMGLGGGEPPVHRLPGAPVQLPSFPLAPAAPGGGMATAPGMHTLPGMVMPGVSKSAIRKNRMLHLGPPAPASNFNDAIGRAMNGIEMPGQPQLPNGIPSTGFPAPFIDSFLPGANNRRKAL